MNSSDEPETWATSFPDVENPWPDQPKSYKEKSKYKFGDKLAGGYQGSVVRAYGPSRQVVIRTIAKRNFKAIDYRVYDELEEAKDHIWLSGNKATNHDLRPRLEVYVAARLACDVNLRTEIANPGEDLGEFDLDKFRRKDNPGVGCVSTSSDDLMIHCPPDLVRVHESKDLDRDSQSPATIVYQAPESITEALSHKNADGLTLFLKERFSEASQGEYAWIAEIKDMGYTHTEIAELLYERAHDSPWMYFEPSKFPSMGIVKNHHLDGCAHQLLKPSSSRKLALWQDQDRDVLLAIEELCGLGGVSPFTRNKTNWNRSAEFEGDNSVVSLRHRPSPSELNTSFLHSARLLRRVADRSLTAVRIAQDAGFCCNSFTILKLFGKFEVKLSQIDFQLAEQMLDCLEKLISPDTDLPISEVMLQLRLLSREIIYSAIGQPFTLMNVMLGELFHIASLALQVLCVGFLSYTQGHIGVLKPFFVDTPLQRIRLLGATSLKKTPHYIEAKLVDLTCLAGLCQGPVLVFHPGRPWPSHSHHVRQKCDVRACPEDILDTWGPGELIFRQYETSPLGIKIGGGYISPSSASRPGIYHWHRLLSMPKSSASSDRLKFGTEIIVGGLVTHNYRCSNNETLCWTKSLGQFEELGTHRGYLESTEYQLGFQSGVDHFNITGTKVWAKRRGRTIKDKNLEREDDMLVPFLDFYWGARVSFCTEVAQRVLLRQLVADLLPAFSQSMIGNRFNDLWTDLESNHGFIQVLRNDAVSIRNWLGSLPEELCRFGLSLVRLILGTLQDTGVSPDGTNFLVAWPHNGVVNRCFRIPLGEDNKWTPMLADSDDCATFAYMSNMCLEAGALTCRGPNPEWEDKIRLPETAVLCPASTEALQHEQTYFFHKLPNNLFWVKCRRESPSVALVKLDPIRSLPLDVMRRLVFNEERKKQRRRLREKDPAAVKAEVVAVWSQNSVIRR